MMFGCWRKVDAADPDTFITAVASVLSGYPEWIVHRVTDPRTGLPSKQQFPPSAFEVRQECERHMETVRWHADHDKRLAHQQLLAIAPPEEKPRKTIEELKAVIGQDWGIQSARLTETVDQAAERLPQKEREEHFAKRAAEQAEAFRKDPPQLSEKLRATFAPTPRAA